MPSLLDRIAGVLTSPRLIIGLVWSGMAVLTVALVVLMRTRWGHQQPLRKCVVLSLFAHVLFAAYATTVHIVRTHPHRGSGTAIRVTELIGTDTVDAKGVAYGLDGGQETTDWDVPATTAPQHPALVDRPPDDGSQPADAVLPFDIPAPASVTDVSNQMHDKPPPSADTAATETTVAEPINATADRDSTPPVDPARADLEAPVEIAKSPATQPAREDDDPTKLVSQASPASETLAPGTTEPNSVVADEGPMPADPVAVDENDTASLVAVRRRLPATTAPQSNGSDAQNGIADRTEVPAPGHAVNAGGTPHTTPNIYRERSAPNKLRIAESYGGSAQTEAAVNAAIAWLVKHQAADGRWDASDHGAGRETRALGQDRKYAGAQADMGLTGLALLAFLGSGHTHQAGPNAATIERGLNYLLARQAVDGNLAGHAELFEFMYCHGMATLALAEVYAMTGDPRLARPVQRAIAYTISAQIPASGGWRYKSPYPSSERGDTSQLGWQVMALKSAELSGITMLERTRQGVVRYLNSVSSGARGGLASYRPEERATHPMTAEALVCRDFLGLSLAGAGDEAADYLLAELPGQGAANFYYWYYGTLAMFQLQGPRWTKWNDALSMVLTRSQRPDADAAGSWDPDPLWGGYGGRVFSTSLGALCLEVYYRYLPLYTVTAGREKSAK